MKHIIKYNEGFDNKSEDVLSGYTNDELLKKFYENPSIGKILKYMEPDEEIKTLKLSIAFLLAGDYHLIRKGDEVYTSGPASYMAISINDEKIPNTIKTGVYKLGNWIVFRFLCTPINNWTDSYISIKVNKLFIHRFLNLPTGDVSKNTIEDRRNIIQASKKSTTGTQLSLFPDESGKPTKYETKTFVSSWKKLLLEKFKPLRDIILKKYDNFYGINSYILEIVGNMISNEFNLSSRSTKDSMLLSTYANGYPVVIITSEVSEKKEEISDDEDYYIFKVYISTARNICFVIKIGKLYSDRFFNKKLSSDPWNFNKNKPITTLPAIPKKVIDTKEMKELLSKIRNKKIK